MGPSKNKRLQHNSLRFLIFLIIFLELITASLSFQTQANANFETTRATNSRVYPLLSDENGPREILLNGTSDQGEYEIPAPSYTVLMANSFLNLHLSHSPLLIAERSVLTVYLDDKPLDSIRLNSTNLNDFNWKVNLPENAKPTNGRFRLKLEANMRASEVACPPPDDPGNWLRVLANSSVSLRLAHDTNNPNLSNLTSYLFASNSLLDRQINVVIAQNPTANELGRASKLLARLGSLAGYTGLDVRLSYGEPRADYLNNIYLGKIASFQSLSRLNLKLPLVNGKFQGATSDTGVIQLGWASGEGGLDLILSGESDSAVDLALNTVLADQSLNLLQGQYALIQPGSDYTKITESKQSSSLNPIPTNGRNILANLGFETQTVNGVGQHESRFNFFVPGSNIVPTDAQLGIDYSYSGLVDPKKSSLTVLVANVSLQAVPLVNKGATGGDIKPSRLNITIPKDLLRAGDNAITFRWNFLIDKEVTLCNPQDSVGLWGTIFRTSEITLNMSEGRPQNFDLRDLPYPFSGSKITSLLIVPDKPSPVELKVAAQLIAELGRSESSGKLDQTILSTVSAVTPEALATNNVVLVGTPATNPLITEASPKLPLKWDSDTLRTLSTLSGLKSVVSDTGQMGLVEISASPWNKSLKAPSLQPALLTVLVPSTLSDSYLEQFINTVARHLYIGKYVGNILGLDSNGKIFALNTKEPVPVVDPSQVTLNSAASTIPPTVGALDSSSPTPKTAVNNVLSRDSSTIFLGAAVAILILVVAFIYFVRRSRKSGGRGQG